MRRASDPDTPGFLQALAKHSDRDVHAIAVGLSKLAMGLREIADLNNRTEGRNTEC
jgi:hypothetical protein